LRKEKIKLIIFLILIKVIEINKESKLLNKIHIREFQKLNYSNNYYNPKEYISRDRRKLKKRELSHKIDVKRDWVIFY